MMQLLTILRPLLLWCLPLLTAGTAIYQELAFAGMPVPGWLDVLFKLGLSGTVGIWTNFFAIKMLFRPHEKTVIGRQGLIPRNRETMADEIAAAVAETLLDSDTILDYLEQHNIIPETGRSLSNELKRYLENPDKRQRAVDIVLRYLRERGIRHVSTNLARLSSILRDFARQEINAENAWTNIRRILEEELADPATNHSLARLFSGLIETNADSIADFINETIDTWADRKNLLKKFTIKTGKRVLQIDKNHIRHELLERINSPEWHRQVLDLVEDNRHLLAALDDNKRIKEEFTKLFENLKNRLDSWLREDGGRIIENKLIAFLDSDALRRGLEQELSAIIHSLTTMLDELLDSAGFRSLLRSKMPALIEKINLRAIVRDRINAFDLAELEAMIDKISSNNLAAIEVLGGILGMVAGIFLIDIKCGLFVSGIIFFLWLIETLLTNWKSSNP